MNRYSFIASASRWSLLAALAAGVFSAQAAVVPVSATWDLNNTVISPALDATVSIANGDHVVFTVDFLGNQALNFVAGGEFLLTALAAGDDLSSFTINNITLELLEFSGTGGAVSCARSAISSATSLPISPAAGSTRSTCVKARTSRPRSPLSAISANPIRHRWTGRSRSTGGEKSPTWDADRP